jgi:hypothetical protein
VVDADSVSRLTARWIESLPGEDSTVVSGLGVQPLLAILAELANDPARSELAAAAGGRYDGLLQTAELRMALGLWTRPEIELQPGVDRFLPPEVQGTLTDQAALDAWVVERTDGLLRRMPIQLTPDVLLVLASALALQTKWALPFTEYPRGERRWLGRTDYDLSSVLVYQSAVGPLTQVTVGRWHPGSAPMPGGKALLVSLEQPFGFIAVHRSTGIPVVAGWVNYS